MSNSLEAKRVKFLPTGEQQRIVEAFVDAISHEQRYEEDLENLGETVGITIPAESPAGTGKTQTTLYCMERIQQEFPGKKIAYLIFNNFMKDEVRWKGDLNAIGNTDYFTFHSFLLHHALQNEKIRHYFHDSEGNPLIDFSKQNYAKKDYRQASSAVLGFNHERSELFFRFALHGFLGDEKKMVPFYREVSRDFLNLKQEEISDRYGRWFAKLSGDKNEICNILREGMRSEISKRARGRAPRDEEVLTLYLSEMTKALFRQSKLTHSAYYKMVYLYAKKENVDLFQGYSAIIVDEAQDIDPIFLKIIESSRLPKLLIGDRHQGIYAFRGSVNMMEEEIKKHGSYAMTYSFRFQNDIAAFSNVILDTKSSKPGIKVVGRYTPRISSIEGDRLLGTDDIARLILAKVESMANKAENHFAQGLEKIPKRKIQKFMAKEKVAIISRNNATLIRKIFKVMECIRKGSLADYVKISLTSSISEKLKKLEKGEFDARTQRQIGEALGENYHEWKKGKPLELIVENPTVRHVLRGSSDYSFLLNQREMEEYHKLMESLSSRKTDSIQKDDKNANLVFTTAHGSKGKEFEEVVVAHDFLKKGRNGENPSDEEVNLAYVAVSRAKRKLYFSEPDDEMGENPIYRIFNNSKKDIEKKLSAPYLYEFPGGFSMEISMRSGAYQYEIRQNGDFLGMFIDFDLIEGVTAGISRETGEVKCFRGWAPRRGGEDGGRTSRLVYFMPDGERIGAKEISSYNKVCDFYYAAGKGTFEDREINNGTLGTSYPGLGATELSAGDGSSSPKPQRLNLGAGDILSSSHPESPRSQKPQPDPAPPCELPCH